MPSIRLPKMPSFPPSIRIPFDYKYLWDGLHLFSYARLRQLYTTHDDDTRLCSNSSCKHNNILQGLAGRYTCSGCKTGTYQILEFEVRGASLYVYSPGSSNPSSHTAVADLFAEQRRQIVEDKIELERDLSASNCNRNKRLPGIPGLSSRKPNKWHTIPGTDLKVTVHPPEDDSYFPPLPSEHGSAVRFLCQELPAINRVNELRAIRSQAPGYRPRQSIPISVSHASSLSVYSTETTLCSQPEVEYVGGRAYF